MLVMVMGASADRDSDSEDDVVRWQHQQELM